jgi:hypothetical protein
MIDFKEAKGGGAVIPSLNEEELKLVKSKFKAQISTPAIRQDVNN